MCQAWLRSRVFRISAILYQNDHSWQPEDALVLYEPLLAYQAARACNATGAKHSQNGNFRTLFSTSGRVRVGSMESGCKSHDADIFSVPIIRYLAGDSVKAEALPPILWLQLVQIR